NATKLQTLYRLATKYPDGILVPDTYYVPIDVTEESLINFLINVSMKRHRELAEKLIGGWDEERWMRYITVASVIQKEAKLLKEMPTVASVIYNRLDKNMPLQMDGTLNYGPYSHVRVTPERIREDHSLYNTYKFKGLPPYPVCVVGKGAIYAAVHPDRTDYLYFVKSGDDTHTFSNSYSEHQKKIRNVQN
ncbi:MAG: endolytic transglycosylase MltG, partial [Campylobacterales bacterium]